MRGRSVCLEGGAGLERRRSGPSCTGSALGPQEALGNEAGGVCGHSQTLRWLRRRNGMARCQLGPLVASTQTCSGLT